ncbi:WG repeat-containing protein [Tenacibaculum jejuense]|uniref:Uncharacterized protein n=1 Tax=Tenacibaculum jejuense TaxID=584609 RepID=A0A238UBF4_9FLAO|nr:WG repeat-containing protein [Tenacibaculum jejuense]SNR16422.1 Protein of unknown function [Tenacibaculum jejuense]
MKNTIKALITILFVTTFFQCQKKEKTEEMKAFIEEFKGENPQEILKEIEKSIQVLKLYQNFDKEGQKVRDIPVEKEKYQTPFQIDTSNVEKKILDFKSAIGFTQTIKDTVSEIVMYNTETNYSESLPPNATEKFTVQQIFYKNGKTVKTNLDTLAVSFGRYSFVKNWGKQQVIDSISVKYSLNYLKRYDSIVLSKKTKKASYKNAQIKLKKLKNNYCYLLIDDRLKDENYKIYAFNDQGKPLSKKGGSSSAVELSDTKENIKSLVRFLENVKAKIEQNQLETRAAIITYMNEKINALDFLRDEDQFYHRDFYYEGNIAALSIYFGKEVGEKTINFTAVNNQIDADFLLKRTTDSVIFVDEDLREIVSTAKTGIQHKGGNYYQDFETNTFYFLNEKKKELQQLNLRTILPLQNGIYGVSSENEYSFKLYSKNHELLSNKAYKQYVQLDQGKIVLKAVDDNFYLVDKNAKIKLLKNVGAVYNDGFSEGLLVVYNKKDKGGYIDNSGNVIIPFKYNFVNKFSEGLAAVALENRKFGFINKKGEVVIPFKYDHTYEFVNGYTMVEYEGLRHIIDRKGNIKVSAKSKYGGFSAGGEGLERVYQMAGDAYDAFGNLIQKEKE